MYSVLLASKHSSKIPEYKVDLREIFGNEDDCFEKAISLLADESAHELNIKCTSVALHPDQLCAVLPRMA